MPGDVVGIRTVDVGRVVTQRAASAVQGAFLGGILDRDVRVEQPPEVDRGREQQEQDRQDERELDHALTARTLSTADLGQTDH